MRLKPKLFSRPTIGHPYSKGLIGCWLFNEGGGGIVNDLSGNGNTGIFGYGANAKPTWVSGKYGNAIRFQRDTKTVITVGDKDIFDGLSQITILAWTKDYNYLLSKRNTVISKVNLQYGSMFNWHLGSWVFGDGDYTKYTFDGYIDGSTSWGIITDWIHGSPNWQQWVVTLDGYNGRLYLDNKLVGGPTSRTAPLLSSNAPVIIGGDCGYGNVDNIYDGIIDHIMIWNRALSASEIARLYRDPFVMFEEDM